MAYDESLANRLRDALIAEHPVEKKMFGGVAFLVDGKMTVGVTKELLTVRASPAFAELALKRPHVRVMDFTGRPMKGWLFVEPEGVDEDDQLAEYVRASLEFIRS